MQTNLSPMAAAKEHSRKINKKGRKRIFCFVGGCFGISNKVSSDHHGDGKLAKHGKPTPVNDQKTSSSDQMICSSREIHGVEEEEVETAQLVAESARKLIDNKKHSMISKNNKSSGELGQVASVIKQVDKQNDAAPKNWTNSTKLSHSVSLPLPRQKKEKPAVAMAANDGGHRGKMGKEIIVAGEIDSMLGALIIMVTLMVMLIWGKVCAILCTAAWFYFIPRLRANINESYVMNLKNGTNRVDFDSREYKKNVVLKGLLERNQHMSPV